MKGGVVMFTLREEFLLHELGKEAGLLHIPKGKRVSVASIKVDAMKLRCNNKHWACCVLMQEAKTLMRDII